MKLATRLLILVLASVLVPMVVLSVIIDIEISKSILREKEDKLFGLAKLLDRNLAGTFDDILREEGALGAPRAERIAVLNARLRDMTDFIAAGNPGVGVGYYHRGLDAVLTYGPSAELGDRVGQSIFPGHQGYEVMATGKSLVQKGRLVRGDILNCMLPIVRGGRVIGYIWSNETLDHIEEQLAPITRRIYAIDLVIFFLITASVILTMESLLGKILQIKRGIEALFHSPNASLPPVAGELSIIVSTINELVENMNLIKCYNKYILEGVLNGVLAVSVEGVVARANKAFFELFPDFGEASLERDYRDAFPPEIRDLVADGLGVEGPRAGVEVTSGGRSLEVYSNRMIDEAGLKVGTVFVFRDITLVRRYERELEEKERAAALGGMALGVVHELKNPLTSVKGFTQLLRHPGVTEEDRERYVGLIEEDLGRMNRLLNDMLVFGGGSRLERKRRDVLVLVRDALRRNDWDEELCRPSVLALASREFLAEVDEFKAGQVFDNVLKNACEAVRAKGRGRILVLVEDDHREVRVRFVDTGIGIKAEHLSQIGKPLFTTKPNGTGFGLAISRKIMEAHGGSLRLESRNGYYTKVSLAFPKAAPREEVTR